MKKLILLLFLLLFFSLFSAGCVERKLTIKSNPPQATVYFNDKQMGKTPTDFDFEWYWTHKVELKKEGYQSVNNYEQIKAPVYMWIPLDLFMEIMPFKIRDYRTLTYELKPLNKEEKPLAKNIKIEEFDFKNKEKDHED
jgi:hypothetical protein